MQRGNGGSSAVFVVPNSPSATSARVASPTVAVGFMFMRFWREILLCFSFLEGKNHVIVL